MGRRFDEVGEEMKLVLYKVVRGDTNDARVEISGKKYSPPETSAMILTGLKEAAEAYLGEKVTKAVIEAVPAYFNDAYARRPKTPAKSRAFKVMRIINEPIAEPLAQHRSEYGRNHRRLRFREKVRWTRYFDPRSGRRRGGSKVH